MFNSYWYNTNTSKVEVRDLSFSPTLDQDHLIRLNYQETSIPQIDRSYQRMEKTLVADLNNLTCQNVWEIINFPRWQEFNGAMTLNAARNAYDLSLVATYPTLSSKLDLAYSMVVDKGMETFASIYSIFCQTAGVTPEHKQEWADLATASYLPQEFIDILLA